MGGVQATTALSMRNAAAAMAKMNKIANIEGIQQSLQEFEKQIERMEISQEMMEESLSLAFDESDAEDEADEIVSQVLDEIGISMVNNMTVAPSGPVRGESIGDVEQNLESK